MRCAPNTPKKNANKKAGRINLSLTTSPAGIAAEAAAVESGGGGGSRGGGAGAPGGFGGRGEWGRRGGDGFDIGFDLAGLLVTLARFLLERMHHHLIQPRIHRGFLG